MNRPETCSLANLSNIHPYYNFVLLFHVGIIPNITDAGRLNISVDVVINITWTGSMDVDNYTINCPNGECNSQYILGNITSTTIRLIKNVTSLVICVTATNACGPLPFCARIVLGNDGQVIIGIFKKNLM